MRLVLAAWWLPDGSDFVNEATPRALLEAIAARRVQAPLADGRLLLEAIDVSSEDAGELGRWAMTSGAEPSGVDHMLAHFLQDDRDGGSHTMAGGFTVYGLRVPFSRYGHAADGRPIVATRDLRVLLNGHTLWRLWGPLGGCSEPRLDPVAIAAGGHILADTDDPEADLLPSVWRRQRNAYPVDAMIEELEAAALSLRLAVRGLEDDITHCELDSWKRQVGSDTQAGDVLGALGAAAFVLVRRARSAAASAHTLHEGLADSLNPFIARALETTDDETNARRQRVSELQELLDEVARGLTSARSELRQAAQLSANRAMQQLLANQERDARIAERFQRRVSIFASVVGGSAVFAGIAGANVDFWPLPMEDGVMARGSFPGLVALVVVAAVLVYWRLRRNPAAD